MDKLKVENVGVLPYNVLSAHTWIDKSDIKHSLTLLYDYNGHAYNKMYDDKLKHAIKLGIKSEFEQDRFKLSFKFPDGFISNRYFILLVDGCDYYLVNKDDLYEMYLNRNETEEPFYNLMIDSIFEKHVYFEIVKNYCSYLNDYIMEVFCEKYIANMFEHIVLNPYWGMDSEELLKVEGVEQSLGKYIKYIEYA